jgi:hypothetical protein
MPLELLKHEIDKTGLSQAFSVLDLNDLLGVIEETKVDASLVNESFYRLLESFMRPYYFPATWQKLADLGWSDDEISGLVDSGLLQESPTTLVSAINLGALSVDEFNEFSGYPNQEVDIFYYAARVKQILAFLREKMTLPRINADAFAK